MARYIFPLLIFGLILTAVWLVIFMWVPPVNGWVVTGFFVSGGLALAAWGTLAIYYLRRIWGPKDSPRYLLRRAIRQGVFLSLVGVVTFLLFLFDAANLVTIGAAVGLLALIERLT